MTETPHRTSECGATDCPEPRWGLKDYCRKHQTRLDRNGTLVPQKRGPKTGKTTAECSRCKTSFKASPRQRDKAAEGRPVYCSRDCQKGDNLVTLDCDGCGAPVVRRKADVRGVRVFCSEDCRNEYGSKPKTGRSATCEGPECERRVWVIPALEGKKRYCSAECRQRAQERRQDRNCGTCQETFTVRDSSDARYCSRDCFHVARRAKPGDRYITPGTGYAWVWIDAGDGHAVKVQEHRHVMSQHIGRPLESWETVHHKTGGVAGRSNNDLSNLELWATRHPYGHRVDEIAAYCREMLAAYGDDQEQARYVEHSPLTGRHKP